MSTENGSVIPMESEVKGFLRSIADHCKNCLRRSVENCDGCACARAQCILDMMKMNEALKPEIKCDPASRMNRVDMILRKGRRPMMSVEIDISDLCERRLKLWTLRKMVKLGKLTISFDGKHYIYALPKKKNKKR